MSEKSLRRLKIHRRRNMYTYFKINQSRTEKWNRNSLVKAWQQLISLLVFFIVFFSATRCAELSWVESMRNEWNTWTTPYGDETLFSPSPDIAWLETRESKFLLVARERSKIFSSLNRPKQQNFSVRKIAMLSYVTSSLRNSRPLLKSAHLLKAKMLVIGTKLLWERICRNT